MTARTEDWKKRKRLSGRTGKKHMKMNGRTGGEREEEKKAV